MTLEEERKALEEQRRTLEREKKEFARRVENCLLYTSPSPRDCS
mgnify:FL=1